MRPEPGEKLALTVTFNHKRRIKINRKPFPAIKTHAKNTLSNY
jgi:hypothetical protein